MTTVPMTKYMLMRLLFANGGGIAYEFQGSDGKVYKGWLMGVSREDGGGSSFILTIRDKDSVTHSVHIRTID